MGILYIIFFVQLAKFISVTKKNVIKCLLTLSHVVVRISYFLICDSTWEKGPFRKHNDFSV